MGFWHRVRFASNMSLIAMVLGAQPIPALARTKVPRPVATIEHGLGLGLLRDHWSGHYSFERGSLALGPSMPPNYQSIEIGNRGRDHREEVKLYWLPSDGGYSGDSQSYAGIEYNHDPVRGTEALASLRTHLSLLPWDALNHGVFIFQVGETLPAHRRKEFFHRMDMNVGIEVQRTTSKLELSAQVLNHLAGHQTDGRATVKYYPTKRMYIKGEAIFEGRVKLSNIEQSKFEEFAPPERRLTLGVGIR